MTAKEEDVAMREEMVVLPRLAPPSALNTPVIVEEPVTARAEEVAPVAERLRTVVSPVLETEKRVVFAPVLEVEATANRLRRTEVEAACTPRVANTGVEDPTVRAPRLKTFPVVVAPPEMVSPPLCDPEPIVEDAGEMKPEEKVARPVLVLAPKVAPPRALNCPEIVEEPVTAREVEVAMREEMVALPKKAPPTALRMPETVEDPVTARAEVVALVKVAPAKPARPVCVVAPKVAPPSALN